MTLRSTELRISTYAFLLLSTLLFGPFTTEALASERGRLLYENHCQSCHDKSVHTRDERLVTSPELLRAWVMSWALHNGFFWGEEEIALITDYLDRTIYHFTE